MLQNRALIGALAIIAALASAGCGQNEVKETVRRDMIDPDATQFREVTRCAQDQNVWRGEFNAKNAYGAYTGFKTFYYSDGAYATFEDAEVEDLMKRCFREFNTTK